MLNAGRRRFLRDGFAATTMPAIAADAGVSVQLLYKTFANKPGLLKALFDVAVVGDAHATPLGERESVRAVIAEPDPRRKIEMFAALCAEIVPRAAPIQLLAREAAGTDPEIAAIYAQMRSERLTGFTAFAAHLEEHQYLSSEVSVSAAADLLWTYNSPELYELLVLERRWSIENYQAHIAIAVCATLLR